MMKSYSQRDPKWAYIFIKGTKLTLGRFGCTISCIADLSTYFGKALTPQDVNNHCSFTNGGLIYWNTARFSDFEFVRREYGRVNENILEALQHPDKAVILQVANASHWVVCTGWQKEIKDFKIADPWNGDYSNMARYGKNITGAAYFRRK